MNVIRSVSLVSAVSGAGTQIFDAQDAPVVRYGSGDLLARLVGERASDVHFEPFAEDFRIRARIDGVLHEVARPDLNLREQLTVRLKIMAQLDIAEKRLPQDGRLKLTITPNQSVDCRISTLPTLFGEKVVVRFLNAQDTTLDLHGLGYEPEQLHRGRNAQTPARHGADDGPTGSGKTVSL